jgi:hypothetical protein
MKRGNGIKDRNDKSSGIEILMAEVFAKINPTEPLMLAKQAARKTKLTRFLQYFGWIGPFLFFFGFLDTIVRDKLQ